MNPWLDFPDPRDPAAPRQRWAFDAPLRTLAARTPQDVAPLLDAVQQAAEAGYWCVGALRYEAALAFDAAFADALHAAPTDAPLAWFSIHGAPQSAPFEPHGDCARVQWQAPLPRGRFDAAVARLHDAIAAGDAYQVNYTAPLHGKLHGDVHALFAALRREQPNGYVALLDNGVEQVLSVSPELFFDWDGERLLARPMKGTAPRGHDAEHDECLRHALTVSVKERAENLMIVDLLRNDAARVAQPGSVQVTRLFHAEALPSVWQMTSDVEARTRDGVRLRDVFAALFPCGSVTGAPKRQAMRLIRELEPEARGVYCGAVGVVRPACNGGGDEGRFRATFNVPIRTVTVRAGEVRCGIGSGITLDADAEGEWREWQHKRAFLDRATQGFELLETFALKNGRCMHLQRHLARLQAAARHFGRAFPAAEIHRRLADLRRRHARGHWRVRMALDAQSRIEWRIEPLHATPTPVRLRMATHALPAHATRSEWTRFKTSWRAHLDAFAPRDDVFDNVLHNADGELTETTRGNIAVFIDGRWVTPPLRCGLLPGIGREVALQRGRMIEQVVTLADLPRIRGWAFLNSLRGWLPAIPVD